MRNCIYLSLLLLVVGCSYKGNQKHLSKNENEELRIDTKMLKSLDDSFYTTGDYQYYDKYIIKINEMIKKYPDQKGLIKVRENMIEIFGK